MAVGRAGLVTPQQQVPDGEIRGPRDSRLGWTFVGIEDLSDRESGRW